ncbi:MAG: peptidoglycan-associated lipoprotein [Gammaproteobacteria bacterium TMED78]|nr:MAG: peptidoglycan-associated lipoprotein [Gammaproteobacteria bacterium TMED78]|tara:strand:+ start:46501 stop:47040 length:540 start_codon:yes stop_codon:yes gene_type:complete
MLKKINLLFFSLLAIILASCSSSPTQQDGTASDTSNNSSSSVNGSNESAMISGASGSSNPDIFEDTSTQEVLSNLLIYFDFDQSDVNPEFNSTLLAHGNRLANNSSITIRLEGHADERGSREYNIGLGERRAQAVRRLLLLQGASNDQITIVSYGEERPVVIGSNEESYSLNRRVEIIY